MPSSMLQVEEKKDKAKPKRVVNENLMLAFRYFDKTGMISALPLIFCVVRLRYRGGWIWEPLKRKH